MRNRLQTAPRWVLALLNGVPFGIAMAIYAAAMTTHLSLAGRISVGLVVGILGGVCFGFLMGRFTHSQFKTTQDAVAHVPDAQRRFALRAAWRGPVPADETVRHAALRMAEDALNNRWWRFNIVVFSGFSVLYLLLALIASPWWWFCFAFFMGVLALQIIWRRQTKRRVTILSAGPLIVD